MLLTLGICSGFAGSICDGAVCKYIYEKPPVRRRNAFSFSDLPGGFAYFFARAVKSTDRVLFAHALDTSAQRALCDNNAKTDD